MKTLLIPLLLLGLWMAPAGKVCGQTNSLPSAAPVICGPVLTQGHVVELLRMARPLLVAQAGCNIPLGQLVSGYNQGCVTVEWVCLNAEGKNVWRVAALVGGGVVELIVDLL